jgi:hypothetical protein
MRRRFRYRLFDAVDKRELGWFMSSREDWKPGDFIGSADRPGRVVLAVAEPEDDADFRAYLVVGAVGAPDATEAVAS